MSPALGISAAEAQIEIIAPMVTLRAALPQASVALLNPFQALIERWVGSQARHALSLVQAIKLTTTLIKIGVVGLLAALELAPIRAATWLLWYDTTAG